MDLEQFRTGIEVELERGHRDPETDVPGDDAIVTGTIALAHLRAVLDYYTRLDRMEKEAEGKAGNDFCAEEMRRNLDSEFLGRGGAIVPLHKAFGEGAHASSIRIGIMPKRSRWYREVGSESRTTVALNPCFLVGTDALSTGGVQPRKEMNHGPQATLVIT